MIRDVRITAAISGKVGFVHAESDLRAPLLAFLLRPGEAHDSSDIRGNYEGDRGGG